MTIKNIFLGMLLLAAAGYFQTAAAQSRMYFINNLTGNDHNTGSKNKPWKTLKKLAVHRFREGDRIFLCGRQVFAGSILIAGSGSQERPIEVSSYGNGMAVINAGNDTGIEIRQARFVHLKNLLLRGNGRKNGNTKNGIAVSGSSHVIIDGIDVSGFQKSGIRIDSSSKVRLVRVKAHDNGFAGILVSGKSSKTDSRDIYIGHCSAENNPGDPTLFNNHSGSGIVVGVCSKVTIEYCVATGNGWDMPRKGNGPVGIWAYEADSVIIQHCISYRNKTSVGGEDGGGFDLDGGVTNSVIQYCLSYENQGSAFGLFQYAGASPWYNNTVRYNISENDGAVSTAKAGIYVWNNSGETDPMKKCYVYNNLIYNERAAAINYSPESAHREFYFYNNIFIGKDQLITGVKTDDVFQGNNWWSITSGFNMNGEKNFKTWVATSEAEQMEHKITGYNLDPKFTSAGHTRPVLPARLRFFSAYQLPERSPLRNGGLNLAEMFNIDTGHQDFNQKPAPANGIGASFE